MYVPIYVYICIYKYIYIYKCIDTHIYIDMHMYMNIYVDTWSVYIYFFHHTTCESTCDTLSSSAANKVDNTVSIAQGGIATPGATK